jgi:hypothetical protein
VPTFADRVKIIIVIIIIIIIILIIIIIGGPSRRVEINAVSFI